MTQLNKLTTSSREDELPPAFVFKLADSSCTISTSSSSFKTQKRNRHGEIIFLRRITSPVSFIRNSRRAPEILFVANDVTYLWGYYLVDEIYPELASLVKTIPEPSHDDNKRIRYKKMQESARKDVEQAFGVLKKK
ncbi:ALP1-like protein [Tanacetum coccineum]